MKKITLLLILVFIASNLSAQITKTKIAEKKEIRNKEPYDSLQNFLGKDVYKYLNQDLYLIEKSKGLRKYGYDNFMKNYLYKGFNEEKDNVYKCCDGFNSKYEDLKGKYFKVLAIHKHPRADVEEAIYGNTYYLELEEKESKDKVYFEYSTEFKHIFPFLVVGFYEKEKKRIVGNEFVFKNNTLKVSSGSGLDIETGKPLTIKTGDKWKIVDLTIEEKYYNLAIIVVNSLGEKTSVSYDTAFNERSYAFTVEKADKLKQRFGKENFYNILQGKVKIGMTKEMCELSWGLPKDINKTLTNKSSSEQWVYEENYLYFDNNELTAIQ